MSNLTRLHLKNVFMDLIFAETHNLIIKFWLLNYRYVRWPHLGGQKLNGLGSSKPSAQLEPDPYHKPIYHHVIQWCKSSYTEKNHT